MTLFVGSNIVKGNINDGMDVEAALKLGKLFGKIYGSPIAVAMDSRTSNQMLKGALTSGIMSVGCDVLDLGMVPTPLIQYFMSIHPDVKCGVTITASFAGPDINGFRVLKAGGIEDPIFDEYNADSIYDMDRKCVPGPQAGEMFKASDFTESYVKSIMSQVDVEAIRAAGLRICLDCRNNAVAAIASNLLMMLSVDCITLGGDRSVLDEDRLIKLGHLVSSQGLNLGVLIEMDADHVMFSADGGERISGDKAFAIMAKAILDQKKGNVVIPINSTTLMEDVIRDNGGTIVHTNIGEQSLVMGVKQHGAVLGGDVFGCFVIPGENPGTCDAFLAMAKMLEIIVKNGPLSKQAEPLPSYFLSRGQYDCPESEIDWVLDRFKRVHSADKMDLTDGIKVFKETGWILVRRSNVKGTIKVYAQANSKEEANTWVEQTINGLQSK